MPRQSTAPRGPGQVTHPPSTYRTRWIPLIPAARAYRVTPFTLSWWARSHKVKAKLTAGRWWFPSSAVPEAR